MSKFIKTDNIITIEAPEVKFNVSNLKLINTPIINNSNDNIVSRNIVTGDFELINASTYIFNSDLQNVGGFNTLVENAGNYQSHNIKTIQSSSGSINIVSSSTNLDLNANLTLNNLPSGGSTILSNPGSSNLFNFKTLLAGTGISINDDVNNVNFGLNEMTPTIIGGIYGSQLTLENNHIGYGNEVPDGSKSNIIGSSLPSSLLADTSNIMSSYSNLSSANGSFSRSNILISGDGSQLNSSKNTHTLVNDFPALGIDMENSIYIGDMKNTKPASLSTCINQNTYGNTIEMSNNSWYIGSGRNNLSIASNEMHFDTGCDKLYYHDLSQNSNTDVLFYDPSTGLITHDNVNVLPPAPAINIYNSDGSLTSNRTLTLGGFDFNITGIGSVNIISSVGLLLDSSLGYVNIGNTTATSVNIGRTGISNTLGGDLYVPDLTLDDTKTSYLSYDSVSKQIYYGTISNIPTVNLYTNNGKLLSNRSLSLGGFNLTINGSGTLLMNPVGIVTIDSNSLSLNLGTSTSSSVTSGRANFPNNIQGNVFLTNTTQNDTFDNILVRDNASNRIYYRNASTIPNMFNTSGTLTAARSIKLGGFNLTYNGTGDINISNTGNVNITPSVNTNIGSLNKNTNMNGSLFFNNISSVTNNNIHYLTYDTVTKQVGYTNVDSGISNSIFSIGAVMPANFGNSGISVFPSSFVGMQMGPTFVNNHSGYDNTSNNGDIIDYALTGKYIPSVNRNVSILFSMIIRNTLEIPNIELQFYDATATVVRCKARYNFGGINTYNTYILSDRITVTAGSEYYFRVNLQNILGSYQLDQAIFSINLV